MTAIRICRLHAGALFACVAMFLLLAGCGGSGSPGGSTGSIGAAGCSPGNSSQCGEVIVAFTDAEGDFTSYTVDVLSLTLERANGSTVEMLPQSARIDFAQLTDLSELVGAASLSPGTFIRGSIRLDYSDAEIYVESGDDIVPVNVYDSEGVLLTADTAASIVDVAIELPASDRLVVTRGAVALLSIDFDLEASHIVDTSTSTTMATAVASPYTR